MAKCEKQNSEQRHTKMENSPWLFQAAIFNCGVTEALITIGTSENKC